MDKSKIPFPQADNMNKVQRLIFLIKDGERKDTKIVAHKLGITERQVKYYLDAVRHLCIIDSKYELTDIGIELIGNDNITLAIKERMVISPVFKDVYKIASKEGRMLSKNEIADLIMESYPLKRGTALRRSTSVIKWIKWALEVK